MTLCVDVPLPKSGRFLIIYMNNRLSHALELEQTQKVMLHKKRHGPTRVETVGGLKSQVQRLANWTFSNSLAIAVVADFKLNQSPTHR